MKSYYFKRLKSLIYICSDVFTFYLVVMVRAVSKKGNLKGVRVGFVS